MNSIAIVVQWDRSIRQLHRYLHACYWQLSPADGLYVVSEPPPPPPDGVPFRTFGSMRECAEAITQDLVVLVGPRFVPAPFVVSHLASATETFDVLIGARRWVSPPYAGCSIPHTELARGFGARAFPPCQFVLRTCVFQELVKDLPPADWPHGWFQWLGRKQRSIGLADFSIGLEDLGEPEAHRQPVGAVVTAFDEPPSYILRAVASCYQQLQDGEPLLVVRDRGATVDLGFLERYHFDGLHLTDNAWAKGLGGCRNTAVDQLQTPWIKFLDADDVLAPGALAALRYPPPVQVQVLCGGMVWVVDGTYQGILAAVPVHPEHLVYNNPLVTSRTFIRRQAILDVHHYDVRLGFEEDYDMWLRIAKRFGLDAFAPHPQLFTYYWLDSARRQANVRNRKYRIDGQPIRDYFCQTYGVQTLFEAALPDAGGLQGVTQRLPEMLA